MKKTTLLLLVLLLCTLWLTACGQTPLSPEGSVPQEESVSTTTTTTTEEETTTTTTEEITTTTTTATTTATTTTTTAKVTANAGGEQTRTEQGDGTTASSEPISTYLVTPPSAQSGESTRKTTAKSAYVPPHLSQDTTHDTTTTTTTTTGPTKDHTLPTVFTEEDRLPEVAVWTDKEVYGRTDKVTIYLRNLSDNLLSVGNEFWLWEQVEGGWETVRDKNGRMAALYQIAPQTPSSDPISVGMKLTDYDLKPNTRYMAGELVYTAEGERWIGAEFMTAEE